jgi:hypothetical protein
MVILKKQSLTGSPDYLLRDMNAAFVPLSLVPAFIEWDQATDHVLLNMWKNSNFQQNKAT